MTSDEEQELHKCSFCKYEGSASGLKNHIKKTHQGKLHRFPPNNFLVRKAAATSGVEVCSCGALAYSIPTHKGRHKSRYKKPCKTWGKEFASSSYEYNVTLQLVKVQEMTIQQREKEGRTQRNWYLFRRSRERRK